MIYYYDGKPTRRRPRESRKVLCVTTGITYESISEAARQTGTYQGNISKCLLGKRKSAGKDKSTGKKLVWKYCDKEE